MKQELLKNPDDFCKIPTGKIDKIPPGYYPDTNYLITYLNTK